jgi:hypothetical protein
MRPLLKEIRNNPLLWFARVVPVVFACHKLKPESHTLLGPLGCLVRNPTVAYSTQCCDLTSPAV